MSLGVLSEDEVAGIREGTISNTTVDKVVALAGVFGVEPGYFLDVVGEPPILHREALDILRDETTSAIARKSFRLPGPEKRMISNVIDEPENARLAGEQEATKSSQSRPPGQGRLSQRHQSSPSVSSSVVTIQIDLLRSAHLRTSALLGIAKFREAQLSAIH